MKIETVVPLPPEDSGLQHCIARFHNRNMDSKRKDKTRFFRREPVMIVNPETKAKVLRYAMGNPGNFGLAPIFPYTFYHLTHYWFAAADIPV
ncbi:hypothetical protein VC940_16030, partial [Citrobacter freundii]|nr:hypothetical protein [Citrobacter freundii]